MPNNNNNNSKGNYNNNHPTNTMIPASSLSIVGDMKNQQHNSNNRSKSQGRKTNNNNNNNNNKTSTNSNSQINNNGSNPIGERVEWSRTQILSFIEDYRQERALWDPNTKGYHIKQTKYEALKALGLKYGAEIRSIRSKIKSLRSSFHREHGKVISSKQRGINYQPMWFAYEPIRFILDGGGGGGGDGGATVALLEEKPSTLLATSSTSAREPRAFHRKPRSERRNLRGRSTGITASQSAAVTEAQAEAKAKKERAKFSTSTLSNALLNRKIEKFELIGKHEAEEDPFGLERVNGRSDDIAGSHADTADVADDGTKHAREYQPQKQQHYLTCNEIGRRTVDVDIIRNNVNLVASMGDKYLVDAANAINMRHQYFVNVVDSLMKNNDIINGGNTKSSTQTPTATTSEIGTGYAGSAILPMAAMAAMTAHPAIVPKLLMTAKRQAAAYAARIAATSPSTMMKLCPTVAIENDGAEVGNCFRDGDGDGDADAGGSGGNGGGNGGGGGGGGDDDYSVDESTATATTAAGAAANTDAVSAAAAAARVVTSPDIDSEMHTYCNILAENIKTEIIEADSLDHSPHSVSCASSPSSMDYFRQPHPCVVISPLKRKLINNNDYYDESPSPSPSTKRLKYPQVHHHQQHQLVQQKHSNFIAKPGDLQLLSPNAHNTELHGESSTTSSTHMQPAPTTSANAAIVAVTSPNAKNSTQQNNRNSVNHHDIDEYGVFGEYVAITIRKLKTSKSKIVVKHLINNLLYDAELGKYDQGISSSKEPPQLYKM